MTQVYRLTFNTPDGVPYSTRHEADDLDMAVVCAQREWRPVEGYELVEASVTDDDVNFTQIY